MTMEEQRIGESSYDPVPPWELRIGSLFQRWLATVVACVRDPKGFGASLTAGTTRWALLFLLLSSLWAAPFMPLALTLAGNQLVKFLGYYLLFSLIQTPIQAFLLASVLSFLLWCSVRIFRGRMTYLAALRGSAYTLGVAALAAPLQLLLGFHTWLGIGAIVLTWSFLIVLQWRLFNAMARASGLPALFAAITAGLPQLLVSVTVGGALFLTSTHKEARLSERTTRYPPAAASARRLPRDAGAKKQHTNTERAETR